MPITTNEQDFVKCPRCGHEEFCIQQMHDGTIRAFCAGSVPTALPSRTPGIRNFGNRTCFVFVLHAKQISDTDPNTLRKSGEP